MPVEYQLPVLYTGLQLQHLEIDTKHEKLLFIEQFTVDSKLENDIMNTYFKLKTFQLIYNHTEIYEWVRRNIFSYDTVKPLSLILPRQTIEPFTVNKDNLTMFEWLMRRIVVKGCAELWNISMLMKLNSESAALSVSHMKFLLEQNDKKRSSVYKNRLVNLLLGTRHWSTELMVESLWWSLKRATRDTNNLKKIHTRGSPFFMGVSLVKLSSYGNVTKLDLTVHTLRVEYSHFLAEFMLKLQECCSQYGLQTIGKAYPIKSSTADSVNQLGSWIMINAKITDFTAFFFNKYEACILISLTEIDVVRSQQMTMLKLDGFQTAILETTQEALMSLNEFTDIFSNIKMIRIEYVQQVKELPQINVYILNDTEAMWNTNLHMHIVTLLRDMSEFRQQFHPSQPEHVELVIPSEPSTSSSFVFDLYAEGNTVLHLKLSERHSMQLFMENFYIGRKERLLLSIEKIFVNIDEMHIFTIKDIDVQSLPSINVLTAERQNYEHFVQATNRVWVTTIGGFKGIFPYDHDFADAVQNEFNSLIKWLKFVHDVKKKPFTADSPLPSDMIIQVNLIVLIMWFYIVFFS